MKKFLAMFLSLVLAMSFTVPAFAEEYTELYDGGEYSADTLVTYTEQSHYCVNIPRTMDASSVTSENPYYFTASLMSLADNQHVEIYTDDISFPMENGKGDSINANIANIAYDLTTYCSNVYGYFRDGQSTSSIGFYINMPSDIKTGSYSGTLTFHISLQMD